MILRSNDLVTLIGGPDRLFCVPNYPKRASVLPVKVSLVFFERKSSSIGLRKAFLAIIKLLSLVFVFYPRGKFYVFTGKGKFQSESRLFLSGIQLQWPLKDRLLSIKAAKHCSVKEHIEIHEKI